MIFISGIHGVGKTYFCDMVKEQLGTMCYSASQLIEAKTKAAFSTNKLVDGINDNQLLLIEAIKELKQTGEEFILDGHFCLLDKNATITRIPLETFVRLRPDAIILLTEDAQVIAARRLERDGVQQDFMEISRFQECEREYAKEISNMLGIPLEVSNGLSDYERIIEFIKRRKR